MQELKGDYTFLHLEHVRFGSGSIQQLADEVKALGGQRALVITGNSLATKTDVIQQVTSLLGPLHAGTFAEIRQHAPKSGIVRAAEMARETNADILISVGGGSPIDAAKIVAHNLAQEGGTYLPQLAVPTTLSAAEFAHVAGMTEEEQNLKTGIADVQVAPRRVILDAALTLATPLQLWLSTGIRALDHAVETLYAPGVHPINDLMALEALRRLFLYLPLSKKQPDDLAVRTELQLAAWMSLFGNLNVRFGLSHNLGRYIGAKYGIPHGVTSCITLPTVMRSMVARYADQLAAIGRVLPLSYSGNDPQRIAMSAADAVESLIQQLGLAHRLLDFGIGEEDLPGIAAHVVEEPSQRTRVAEILRQML